MKILRNAQLAIMLITAGLSCGCTQSNNKAVAALVDVSLTYFDHVSKAQHGIYQSLAEAGADDYYFVSVIGDRSFTQDAIVASAKMEFVPSRRTVQLLNFKKTIETHALLQKPQQNTDIRGAILLAQQELSLRDAGRRYLIMFSDLDEDPAKDINNRPTPSLAGYTVILSSIKRLPKDNRNPELFTRRVEEWRVWFSNAGADEVLITDERTLRRHLK